MNYDEQHRKHLMAYLQQIERLFYQLVGTAVFIALKTDYKELIASTLFAFASTKKGKSFEKELANFSNQLDQIIKDGITNEWAFANSKHDTLIAHTRPSLANAARIQNLEALEAFKSRTFPSFGGVRGGISDKVWDIAKKAQTELELALSVSLEEGKSAAQLSREVRNLLNNPTALFRRVRDQYGNLVLSKNAQNYHPGQGVYRSAYKNALRLTSNEINVAYKSADWLRIQQNPDIVGFEVRLSPQHKVYDMCDELKGKYPKTFHFHGWHVGCKCHIITLLKTDEELIKELKADETLPPESSSNYVAEVPNNYKQWVDDNKDRFKNWKTKPYFIEANKTSADNTNKIQERLKDFQQLSKNPNYTDVKFNKETGGLKASHRLHSFDPNKGHYEKEARDILFNNGHKIILEKELPDKGEKVIDGIKHIDGYLNNSPCDISTILGNGKNTIKKALQHSEIKEAKTAILYFPNENSYSKERMFKGLEMFKAYSNHIFENIVIIADNEVILYK